MFDRNDEIVDDNDGDSGDSVEKTLNTLTV